MVVYGQVTNDVISGDVFGRIEHRYPRCTTTWYVLPFGIGTVALALLTWEELAGQGSVTDGQTDGQTDRQGVNQVVTNRSTVGD